MADLKKDPATNGGTFTIPDGYFVYSVDLDADQPKAIICDDKYGEETEILIPKALAFYLTTHFCGSEKMQKTIEDAATKRIQDKFKSLLSL